LKTTIPQTTQRRPTQHPLIDMTVRLSNRLREREKVLLVFKPIPLLSC